MGSARSPRSRCVALAICMFPINPQGWRTSNLSCGTAPYRGEITPSMGHLVQHIRKSHNPMSLLQLEDGKAMGTASSIWLLTGLGESTQTIKLFQIYKLHRCWDGMFDGIKASHPRFAFLLSLARLLLRPWAETIHWVPFWG